MIEKGLLGPGFLAPVAVERFGRHLPYNRLEKKYAPEGLSLSRSVLERSMKTPAEILKPIRDQLLAEILAAPELFTDDTPVTIARPRAGPGSKQGRVWIYLDREGRGAYDFTDSRKGEPPRSILRGYLGAIHADAYPGYDRLFFPERALRAVAVGRKNWLSLHTEGGGDTAVVVLSLVMTAKAVGIDPRIYLRDVMLRIGRETDAAKLTPHGWREHFQAEVEAERDAALVHFAGA